MNSKIIAVVAVAILIVAGAGVFFLLNEKDKEINILAGVNTDGSGLYIDKSININEMFDAEWNPIPSGWDGKIFGTPGTATIQHIQLLQIVDGMKMAFKMYVADATPEPNTVYFVPGVSSAGFALSNTTIDGGSLWQPQYQKIVSDTSSRFKPLALTNDLFPGHACCVVAGNHAYTSSHEKETVRFLAAYTEAVNWVNDALKAGPGNNNYDTLIGIAMEAVSDQGFTEEQIKDALETVIYYYGDDSSTPLAYLSGMIASLSEELVDLPGATGEGKDLANLGFSNGEEFADAFVDDSFLVKGLQLASDPAGTADISGTTTIKVAVIAGDVHQIAIHVAKKLGFFEKYGLNIVLVQAKNGPMVALALQNGEASFGLLGAPPITITVINGELLKGSQ